MGQAINEPLYATNFKQMSHILYTGIQTVYIVFVCMCDSTCMYLVYNVLCVSVRSCAMYTYAYACVGNIFCAGTKPL